MDRTDEDVRLEKFVDGIKQASAIIFPVFDGKLENVGGMVVKMMDTGSDFMSSVFMLFVGFLAEEGEYGDEVRLNVLNNGLESIFSVDDWKRVLNWNAEHAEMLIRNEHQIDFAAHIMLSEWKLAKKANLEKIKNMH